MNTKRTIEEIEKLLSKLEAKYRAPLVYLGYGPIPATVLMPERGLRIVDGLGPRGFENCIFAYTDTEYITTPDVVEKLGLGQYGVRSSQNFITKKITL